VTPPDSLPPLDELLSRRAWLSALARRLVDDPHLADDLVQETTLEALRRPPPGTMQPGWLSTVMRHVLGQLRRADERRARREQSAADARAVPEPHELVSAVQAQAAVAEAVLALDEPYRSTVLLRFWEDLPPREIARRQGVAVATVDSRLQRAFARLRAALSERDDTRAGWAVVLAPLLDRRSTPAHASPLLGSLIVKSSKWIVAGLAVLVAGAAWMLWPEAAAPAVDRVALPPAAAAPPLVAPEFARTTSSPVPLEVPPSAPPASAPSEPVLAAAVPLSGRLVDVEGAPLPGLAVVGVSDAGLRLELEARSNADGSFQVRHVGGAAELRVGEPGWATVAAGLVAPGREALVVAGPALALAGIVTDEAGAPVAGADVRLVLPADLGAGLPVSLDATRPVHQGWRALSADDGRFALREVAHVEGARLAVRALDFDVADEPAPEVSRDDLQLVLRRTAPDPRLLVSGVVRDPAGLPVADARVVLGRRGTRSDAEGRFRLVRDAARPDEPLLALARGYLPGRAVVPAAALGEAVVVDVRLGGEPLSLDGTLLDESGQPVAGARVWIDGGELVGGLDGRLATVEGWLGGGETLLELRARLGAAANGQSSDALRFDHPTEYWGWVLTDARGHFRIEGLLPRDYRLEVLMIDRLRRESFGPFPAGTAGLQLVLTGPSAIVVAGRVVGLDGTPVAGVEVQLHAWVLSVGDGTGDAHTGTRDAFDGPVRRTDESGRFDFEPVSVPERELWLAVSSDTIMNDVVGMEHGLSPHGPLDDLTIPVVRRLHVRVELPVPAMADAFAVLDERAERLALVSFEGEGRRSSATGVLIDGRSPVYAVEETARTLVLLRGGEEVWWRPIELTGQGVNVLGP